MHNEKITHPLTEQTPYPDFVARLFAPVDLVRENQTLFDHAPGCGDLDHGDVVAILQVAVLAGQLVDSLKRQLFYGTPHAFIKRTPVAAQRLLNRADRTHESTVCDLSDAELDLLHGAIGLVTESCELLEPFLDRLQYDAPLDFPNVVEEGGDAGFYLQALFNRLRSLGLPDPQTENKSKLLARYHQGAFSRSQAVARADKGAEE